jgi:hypothetical protein
MSIPRRARVLLSQRDMVLKAHATGHISADQALAELAKLRWQRQGHSWSIRPDLDNPKLVLTDAQGGTKVLAETRSWLATWWPAIPLLLLSALALWGFVTSTEDPGRVQDAPVVSAPEP